MVVMWKMFETKMKLFTKELQYDKSFWKKEEIVKDHEGIEYEFSQFVF